MTPIGVISCGGSAGAQSRAAADVNGDGVVDALDFMEFAGNWINDNAAADLSLDGAVDGSDIDQFVDAYNAGG